MRIHFIKRLLIVLLITQCKIQTHAQEAKVFSKYNYYTTEVDVQIIAELSSDKINANYSLSVFKNEKLLDSIDILENSLLKVKLPLSLFDFGETVLQYVISSNDNAIQKGMVLIVRLQPKANEVKIDLQTGGVIADGLPFFPFGFYCRPVGNLPEQEVTHGFNMIGPYQSNLPDTYEERKAYMDRCAQLGIKVQYSVNSLIGSGHNGARGLDMSEEEKEALLKKEVIAFRDHPALLSWYINDEPDGQSRPVPLLEKVYKIVHELDPYHPVSIVFMLPSKFKLFRNTMDIAMTDPYPVPGPLDIVEQFVKQMNRDFSHEKSIWLVPQAFGGQEMWAREPTAKEIRLMTYVGLVNGVKGIQYYTHAPGNLNPQSVSAWSVCSDIAVEVNQMSSFLLSDEAAPSSFTPDSNILVKSFSHNNDLLVIAVNKENRPRSFTIQVNDPDGRLSGAKHASLWFENREINFDRGNIADIIDAYGTRIYLIKGTKNKDSIKPYKGNLTFNPGFEKIVSPGLPIGSNTKKSFQERKEQGASFFIDSRQSVEGMFSLRLITPVDSTGNKIRLLPMVISAGNSYTASVWVKAKEQKKMPVLRINIEGPNKQKTFALTNEWQQYSFTFRTDSLFSSAILSFDLLTAGTAWFDLIQLTPDPLISYTINEHNVATVNIDKTLPNAEIKYSLGKDAKKTYSQAFSLNRSSTVNAGIFIGDSLIAQTSLFIPVDKALNKPVTIQSEYAPQYAASGNATLTDGMMGSTAFKDGRWLGFSGRDVIAVVDLRKEISIHSIAANFLCDPNSGIFLPPKISFYTSVNGKDFQFADEYINNKIQKRGEPHLRLLQVNMRARQARYIKIVAQTFGDIPEGYLFKGTKSWIFIDEIMVD